MTDKVIKVNVTATKKQSVNISAGNVQNQITATPDSSQYYSNLSKNWAIGEGLIQGVDYSSKTYAEQAKVDANNAKAFSETVQNTYTNFQDEAQAAITNINNEENTAIISINNNKDFAISAVNTAKNEAVNSVNNTASSLANRDLSNLSTVGQAKFNEKANVNEVLKKNQITNCLLEVPQRIKYTLEDGVLTIKAGSVVIYPFGTTNLTAQYPKGTTFLNNNLKVYDTQYIDGKFFVWAEKVVDSSYGTTVGTISDRVLWSNDSGGLSSAGSDYIHSGATAPTTNPLLWYDTQSNIIKRSSDNGVTWIPNNSFPLLIGDYTKNYGFNAIDQVFNGFGYIGRYAWFDKGIKCLFGIKRNPDGTIENKELITNFHVWETHKWTEGRLLCINSHGTQSDIMPSRLLKGLKSEMPSEVSANSLHFYICTDTLEVFSTNTKVANWKSEATIVPIFEYGAVNPNDGNTLTYFKPFQTFRAVDYNEIRSIPLVANKYTNGTSWYRVWSDGWIEQGGRITSASSTIITFPKKFSNTNYTIALSQAGASSSAVSRVAITTYQAESFTVQQLASNMLPASWYACGY